MTPLDLVEQGDSSALHSENADAMAHFRPFEVEVVLDERIAQIADMQVGGFGLAPFDPAIPGPSFPPTRSGSTPERCSSTAPWAPG